MLYEVTTTSGRCYIQDAGNNHEAKVKACKEHHVTGIGFMKAQKVNVDYPEVFYRPLMDDETLEPMIGKDVVLYDEHHGTATRIRKATAEQIRYFMGEYTSIIVL